MDDANLGKFISVDSAGTSRWHIDEPPDQRSSEIAIRNGITLDHLGRQITYRDLDEFDYIVAMDSDNYDDILRIQENHGNGKAEIFLMRDYDDQQSGADVPDPYYGGSNGFQLVYDLLDESLTNFLTKIIKDHRLA